VQVVPESLLPASIRVDPVVGSQGCNREQRMRIRPMRMMTCCIASALFPTVSPAQRQDFPCIMPTVPQNLWVARSRSGSKTTERFRSTARSHPLTPWRVKSDSKCRGLSANRPSSRNQSESSPNRRTWWRRWRCQSPSRSEPWKPSIRWNN